MGWDAFATKDGEVLKYQGDDLADPVLRTAFADAATCVKRDWGCVRIDLAEGKLDGYDYIGVIERATRELCFIPNDIEWIGEIYWPPEIVLGLFAGADWDFPREDLIEIWSDRDDTDEIDDFRLEARLLVQTCAEHGLGIKFTW